MNADEVIKKLKKMGSKKNKEGMARFGIETKNALGISLYVLRPFGKEIGKDQKLAEELWETGIHEARMLATFIGEPEKVTEKLMEKWVRDFDSWDIVDQCCSNLFDKTEFAYAKAFEWSERGEEFVKRAGFVLMATLSVHDKEAGDKKFEKFFPVIKREATDERNFVKKAVNWALRQIGKRNLALNKKAVKVGKEISEIDSKAARWIAADALRELESEKVLERLRNKK
ncbi:MAG: DNA alkylation repair protein [Candidatus Diapherotrites archaeon]